MQPLQTHLQAPLCIRSFVENSHISYNFSPINPCSVLHSLQSNFPLRTSHPQNYLKERVFFIPLPCIPLDVLQHQNIPNGADSLTEPRTHLPPFFPISMNITSMSNPLNPHWFYVYVVFKYTCSSSPLQPP